MEIKNYIFLITKNYNFSLLKMKTVDVVGKKWKVREVDKKFKNYILAIFRCEQMWFVECEQITFFKQKKGKQTDVSKRSSDKGNMNLSQTRKTIYSSIF